MQTSTELELAADIGKPASSAATRGTSSSFFSLLDAARNDPSYAQEALPEHEGDAWPRHAHGANGFGDGAGGDATGAAADDPIDVVIPAATRNATNHAIGAAAFDATPFARPDGHDLHLWARHQQAMLIGETIAGTIVAVAETVYEAFVRYRRHRQAAATYATLRELDDHMLHDLGFDRSELSSVAAESAGEAELTRMRPLLQSQR